MGMAELMRYYGRYSSGNKNKGGGDQSGYGNNGKH